MRLGGPHCLPPRPLSPTTTQAKKPKPHHSNEMDITGHAPPPAAYIYLLVTSSPSDTRTISSPHKFRPVLHPYYIQYNLKLAPREPALPPINKGITRRKACQGQPTLHQHPLTHTATTISRQTVQKSARLSGNLRLRPLHHAYDPITSTRLPYISQGHLLTCPSLPP